jgi:hypothetical protein
MIDPLRLPDPFAAVWYHGTDASQFKDWMVPPPGTAPFMVAHSAVFFSTERDYATAAGPNVCQVSLLPSAKILTPGRPDWASDQLRKRLAKSHPLAEHCTWVTDEKTWARAWATGEVMRYGYNPHDREAAGTFDAVLNGILRALQPLRAEYPDSVIREQALHCLTRSWIEQIVRIAKQMGYQAVHGAEVDKWRGAGLPPIARSWLAVLDASVITDPAW